MTAQRGRYVLVACLLAGVLALGATALAQTAPVRLAVTEMVLARSLTNGEPTEPVTAFTAADEWIFCFVRTSNRTGAETAIFVGIEQDAGEVGQGRGGIRLTLPASSRYRTFARFPNRGREAGPWRCVARSERGNVLQHSTFQIGQ